jgi:hypothetical protein
MTEPTTKKPTKAKSTRKPRKKDYDYECVSIVIDRSFYFDRDDEDERCELMWRFFDRLPIIRNYGDCSPFWCHQGSPSWPCFKVPKIWIEYTSQAIQDSKLFCDYASIRFRDTGDFISVASDSIQEQLAERK